MNASSRFKLIKVADHSTANTTAVNSTGVDTQGFEGVLFLTSFGTAAADNTVNLAVSSDDGSADDYTDVLGSSVALGGASDEDQWIDCYRPVKRYVRLEAARGTSTTLESIWALLYGARVMPIDNTTTGTIAGELSVSAAEGTA